MKNKEALYKKVAELADQIQTELVSLGCQGEPVESPVEVDAAFGAGSMTFTGWLWSVFLPRVKEILRTQGKFPKESYVGTQAIRELDGWPEAERLVSLLSDFDYLIER